MPLSEHEQRQLEQIEQALYADYPKLAQAVRAKDPRIHFKRRLLLAMVGFVLGAGVLAAGVITRRFFPWIPAGGFVVMLACAIWALNSWRHMGRPATGHGPGRGGRSGRRGRKGGRRGQAVRHPAGPRPGFMERMEERWRRRQEGDR
ncbi:MAG: DUF3040 domain-containing protein [Nocardiopsaceae bacterium]|nr:DUF3040 domain-containing protein [Nocardiopsaceae bacterium]